MPEKRPLKTLERVLSKAGMGSRTEARKWIAAGRVISLVSLISTSADVRETFTRIPTAAFPAPSLSAMHSPTPTLATRM